MGTMDHSLEKVLTDLLLSDDIENLDEERHLWKKGPVDPICDFKIGLEWFNSQEPLSIGRQLRGKIVILDFFTYCCINCLHILPHLRQIEERFSVEDGVVIVGVHSAKFDNEKDSANISAALKRYDITHPVVNDSEGELWSRLKISCWPTVLVLGPEGQPLYKLVGEFDAKDLMNFVSGVVSYFGSSGVLSSHHLPLSSATSVIKGPLLFPGKVTTIAQGDGSELIAIANTGLHTVIIASAQGIIQHVIGNSGQPGFVDGDFATTLFNAPQGLAFSSCDCLFVADSENHAIRKIDLRTRRVVTIAGNGLQATSSVGGSSGATQSLSSPWDLCYIRRKVPISFSLPQPFLCICPPAPPGYVALSGIPPPYLHPFPSAGPPAPLPPSTPTPPPPPPSTSTPPPPPPPPSTSALPPPPPPLAPALPPSSVPIPPPPVPNLGDDHDFVEQEVLLIAMAGFHQIWALFFQDTVWWGKEFFPAGTCVNVAGSGSEANKNNSYPRSASFAQPSGLTFCPESDEVYIADSESSSVRSINLKSGKVSAVVGGSRTPDDLFAFGDLDGEGFKAKLQHPLGVVWHATSGNLLVADSYNHKIKAVKLASKTCTSLIGAGAVVSGPESQLNEPGGLCVSADQKKLYIADTNNHCIKVFDFANSLVAELLLHRETIAAPDITDLPTETVPLRVSLGGSILLQIKTSLQPGIQLTEGAPQRWTLKLPDLNWKADSLNGTFDPERELTVQVTAPSSDTLQAASKIKLSCRLFLCANGACKAASSSLWFSIICDPSAPKEIRQEALFII